MDTTKESEILKIIEKLTTTGTKTFDETLMKKLKAICKISDEFVNYAYYVLMAQLRKDHSEIRYSTLLTINEFFCRSSAFRKLLENDLEEFLELVAETNPENPLPLPPIRAKELKLKSLEIMQAWTTKFGEKYIRLQLALSYLKNCKKIDFNDMQARTVAQRERERQEQEKIERILNEKINKIKLEILENSEEINNILLQMENCFQLLPTEELFSCEDFKMQEKSECDNSAIISLSESNEHNSTHAEQIPNALRQHGIYDMKNTITIEVPNKTEVSVKANEDTLPIIDNLNDLYKQLSSTYLPKINAWLKTLTKGNNCTDNLKRAIDLKNMIESAFEKYKKLKISDDHPQLDDSEDDEFEEVTEKEGFEAEAFKEKIVNIDDTVPGCSKDYTPVEKAYMWKFKHSNDDMKDPTSAVSTLTKRMSKHKDSNPPISSVQTKKEDIESHKTKLLEKAPIMPYDIDLFHWEEEKPLVPEIVKFDSLHKFWESKNSDDENETLKEAQRASLRTRKIDFSGKFEPVKWACRAPLPSGKLCPRKDRFKCPFHGKIVKRDAVGNPVDNSEAVPSTSAEGTSKAVPDWQDPALLRDIEAATGVNLQMPQKRGKKKGRAAPKESGLTNINKMKSNTRDRLKKKIIKRYKHYAKKIDDAERKKFNDKFGDQWNYY